MHVEPFKRSQRVAIEQTVVVDRPWTQGTDDRPEPSLVLQQLGVVASIPHRHISG